MSSLCARGTNGTAGTGRAHPIGGPVQPERDAPGVLPGRRKHGACASAPACVRSISLNGECLRQPGMLTLPCRRLPAPLLTIQPTSLPMQQSAPIISTKPPAAMQIFSRSSCRGTACSAVKQRVLADRPGKLFARQQRAQACRVMHLDHALCRFQCGCPFVATEQRL